MNRLDTIVAVSSPPGRSARGLIRLDGPEAFAILDALVEFDAQPPPHHVVPARLRDPSIPVLVARFPGPRSYTGSDVAELQLPGHPALLERMVLAAVDASGGGGRLAEPGEFTFRAYTAGKLDLTRAEGVAATIHAVSDGQLAAAAALRHGELARFAAERVDHVGRLLALVEAGIDFVDQDDVVPIPPPELAAALEEELQHFRGLLERSRSWGAVEALPRVVLVGPPSAGKSTLFNALLGRPRAVTDAAPGTTRDVLEEPLTLSPDGNEVMLVDLAGLDNAASALDRDVQQRVRGAINHADLLLLVGETELPVDTAAPTLRIHTMSDLRPPAQPTDALRVSGVTGEGLDTLRAAIRDRLGGRAVSVSADRLALQPRHHAALHTARDAVAEAIAHVDPDARSLDEVELVAGALRHALDEMAGLGGELTPDAVIGRVFATFCVGK